MPSKKLVAALCIGSLLLLVWLLPASCSSAGLSDEVAEALTVLSLPHSGERADISTSVVAPPEANMPIGDTIPVSCVLAERMLYAAFGELMPDTVSPMLDAPGKPLTIGEVLLILQSLGADELTHSLSVASNDGDKPLSYAVWVRIYNNLLGYMSDCQSVLEAYGIREQTLIVLATSDSHQSIPEGNVISDKGAFSCLGINLSAFIDKQVSVLTKDCEIIALFTLISGEPTIRNVYVTDSSDSGVTVFCGGAERFYRYAAPALDDGCGNLVAGDVADITVRDGQALSVDCIPKYIEGEVIRVSLDLLELEGYSPLPLDSDFKVYDVFGGMVHWKGIKHLIVGSDTARFYVQDGIVCAAVIMGDAVPEKLRVLIGTSGYAGFIHQYVSITSDSPFSVYCPDAVGGLHECASYSPNEIFTVGPLENSGLFGQPRVIVKTGNPIGTLQVVGLQRNWPNGESPRYLGTLEVAVESGGYSLINEISLEEYLCSVLPSEMPTSYGLEALKCQAVAARSFAHNQFYENRYHAYGANIDDSVNCQVYNNIPADSSSVDAVMATYGECLTYGGQVISANFFSTSSGMTANNGEVWAEGPANSFPSKTLPYLSAKRQYRDNGIDYGDLSQEANAAVFFSDTAIKGYDSVFPWFRWQCQMTAEAIAFSVNARLRERYNAAPTLIMTWMPKEGRYRSVPVCTIGELLDMAVVSRGQGGNVMQLLFTGTLASVLVSTEYNIRSLLRPAFMQRRDGQLSYNAMMPSAFFSFELITDADGGLCEVSFFGGGYGHGSGMSQNGAKGMVDSGYTYEEVLQHFYEGTTITKIY